MSFNFDQNLQQDSSMSPLSYGWQFAISYITSPSVASTVNEAIGGLWNGLSFLKDKAEKGYQDYTPNSVKKIVDSSGKFLDTTGKVAIKGIISIDEFLDFTNSGGTKDPSASIEKSRARLSQHNLPFANCIDFLADQAAEAYFKNEGSLKSKICEAISEYPTSHIYEMEGDEFLAEAYDPITMAKSFIFEGASSVTDWFMSLSKDLIGQTIKANIMHIAANLADEAYDDEYEFEDNQRNPFGRLLSVIGNSFTEFEGALEEIPALPEEERDEQYAIIFQEISSALLTKLFPKGEQDLQLFHHTIPFIKVIKSFLWEKINDELPPLLERLYRETRPLEDEHEDWKENFDAEGYGLKADQLLDLPSTLINQLIRSNRGKALDALKPVIEKSLKEKNLRVRDVEEFTEYFFKYTKEFFLTDDPALHKLGAFFERYFMEHILLNLSEFVQDDDETPMPLYILKQWIEGDLFKALSGTLAGATLSAEDKSKAVDQLLAPFGLNRHESFPLPPSIKEKAWSAIEELIKEKAPDLLLDLLPKWMALKNKDINESALDDWLDDPSVTDTVFNLTGTLTDTLFNSLKASTSIAQKLNEMLPPSTLSDDQQKEIDEQWVALTQENQSLDILKGFAHQCVEALVLQICRDLYKNYQKKSQSVLDDSQFDGLERIFDEGEVGVVKEDEIDDKETEKNILSFSAWLLVELTKACEALAMERINDQELKALQRAIELKNAIRDSKDSAQAKLDQTELDQLWPEIQHKFDHLLLHLLKIMGYQRVSDLPLPKELQPVVWKGLSEKLPYILFEQFGDLMLPLLEKEKLQDEVTGLPEGELIKQGCEMLAGDIISHLPEWLDGKFDSLPEMLSADESDIDLSDKAGDYLVEVLNAIIKVEDPAYEPVWKWLKSYLEGLFLKVASKIGKMSQDDIQEIVDLVQQTKNELLALDEEVSEEEIGATPIKPKSAEDILANFTDQLFVWLGVETPKDLFGIPQVMQEKVLKEIKVKVGKGLLGFYQMEQKIRNHVVEANHVEEHLPTSEVAKAALALTRYVFDKATDTLTQRVDGEFKVISNIYDPLNLWLDQMDKENYQVAGLFQDVIAKGVPTPWLEKLIELLDANSSQSYKLGLADWINPVLTDQVIRHLTPLLEKEQEGQAEFDQAILTALLPVLTRHLKHLNAASQKNDGLNYANFVDSAGAELHPAIALTKGDEEAENKQKQAHFYQNQADLIFKLIFPKGKENLAKLLPDLEISDDQYNKVLNSSKDLVASQLPQAVDVLFDKEMLTEIFTSLFEAVIESLDKPITISRAKKLVFTAEELANQKEMDVQMGQLMVEAAKFIDLPVSFFEKLPGWMKGAIGLNSVQNSTYESIGAAVREQFNGELFATTLERVLPKLAEKKHLKSTPSEKAEANKKAEANLKKLEREVAKKSLAYAFSYLGARIEHATDIFTNPVLKFINRAVLSMCSFVFVTCFGSLLRFFKIEGFVVNRLFDLIQHASEKTQTVFSQPELHEDLIYHGVEAFEQVLTQNCSEEVEA